MEKPRAKSSKASKNAATTSDTKCTVCHKVFCEPKLLPCGHLMCRKCLLSWLKQSRHATCPYCRYPIIKNDTQVQALPASSATKEDAAQSWDQGTEWDSDDTLTATVDQFPTDLSMEVVVKAEQMLNQKKKNCHVCDLPAAFFCFHCGDTLCLNCRNGHSKLAVTRHHVVEELGGLTAKRLADFQPPTPCPQHPEEPCRLFCPQHKTSLCLLCATSRHRDCPQVAEFEQLVGNSKTKLAVMLKELTDSSTEMEKAVKELDQHLADTEQRTETALADIQKLQKQLIKSVKDRCQQLVLQANTAREDIREAVKEAKVVLQGRQSRLGSHNDLAQRVLSSTAHAVVCDMTTMIEARLKDLDCHVQLPTSAKDITKATLVVEKDAAHQLKEDLAKLGQIKVEFAQVAASVAGTFHKKHDAGVTLSNADRTATSTAAPNSYNCCSVVVKSAMTVGILTEVQVQMQVQTQTPVYVYCPQNSPRVGVITQSPDTFSLQQIQWRDAQVQTIKKSMRSPSQKQHYQCQEGYCYDRMGRQEPLVALSWILTRSLNSESRLGVYLDDSYGLHLYVDGENCGTFSSNIKQPCYALFTLADGMQITLLPHGKI